MVLDRRNPFVFPILHLVAAFERLAARLDAAGVERAAARERKTITRTEDEGWLPIHPKTASRHHVREPISKLVIPSARSVRFPSQQKSPTTTTRSEASLK